MRHAPSWIAEAEERQAVANRQTASLAGLAVVLFLVVAGLFLFQHLRTEGLMEDCLLAGRSNCTAPVLLLP